MIEDNDVWIAAHALEHGTAVVTSNEEHFKRVADLLIENWAR